MSEPTTQADKARRLAEIILHGEVGTLQEMDDLCRDLLPPVDPAQSEPLTDEARSLVHLDGMGTLEIATRDHEVRLTFWDDPEDAAPLYSVWVHEVVAWRIAATLGPAPSEALEGLIEKHPLDALLAIADRLLAEFYPESVFPDVPDEPADGDSGPQLVRAVRRARADLARDSSPGLAEGDRNAIGRVAEIILDVIREGTADTSAMRETVAYYERRLAEIEAGEHRAKESYVRARKPAPSGGTE